MKLVEGLTWWWTMGLCLDEQTVSCMENIKLPPNPNCIIMLYLFHPHVQLHLHVTYFISIIHMTWGCLLLCHLVSFHNESSFASFNFIHVGCQKPSNRFCFIYLTNFISVMGFFYIANFKFIPYGHISSVSSKHPYSPMSSILCEV